MTLIFMMLQMDFTQNIICFQPTIKLVRGGHELYGEVGVQYDEIKDAKNVLWVDKRHYSAFSGTNLDSRLRERAITEIYLVSVVTDICILHTAIDAYNLGYKINIHEAGVNSFNVEVHKWGLKPF